MRICDVNNNYSTAGGGVRTYHHEKLRYYRARPEHAYALVVPSRRPSIERDGSVTVYRVPSIPLLDSGYRWIVAPGVLREMFADFRPDVVEVGSAYVLPFAARVASSRCRMVGFFHSDYPAAYVEPILGRRGRRLADRHARWVYGRMDAVLAASRYAQSRLEGAGVRRVVRTPLAVDTARFGPDRRSEALRQALGVRPGRAMLLFLGRWAAEKGIDLLLEAYPRFRDPERLVLVIAGRGPAARRVGAFARRFPEVRTVPHVADQDRVAELCASADTVLALGRVETFGLGVLEALASGTPVVVPAAGGAEELVRESGGGVVFEPYDPIALGRAVRGVLDAGAAELGERGRAFAVGLGGWETTFRRIHAVYEAVADR